MCVCVCACMGYRDIVLKLHVWIPHGKIADAYFWFSLNYLPLLNYGPLTNNYINVINSLTGCFHLHFIQCTYAIHFIANLKGCSNIIKHVKYKIYFVKKKCSRSFYKSFHFPVFRNFRVFPIPENPGIYHMGNPGWSIFCQPCPIS